MHAEVTQALEQFNAPSFSSVRPDVLAKWQRQWPNPALAGDIAANPRLAARMEDKFYTDLALEPEPTALDEDAKPVVGLLMSTPPEFLALRVGCAFHHASVLAWLTWNKLGTELPQMTLAEVRALLMNIPQSQSERAGAPQGTIGGLTQDDLLSDGADCVAAWLACIDKTTLKRLTLFCDVQPGALDIDKADLVNQVAQIAVGLEENTT